MPTDGFVSVTDQVIQQDNDPERTVKNTQELLTTKLWTSVKPDRNSTEHLWKDLQSGEGTLLTRDSCSSLLMRNGQNNTCQQVQKSH